MSDIGDDPPLIVSRHSGTFTRNGITVEVRIYRIAGTNWTLEVVDPENNPIVWDDGFATDDDAHAEFLRTIESEGIAFIYETRSELQ